MASDISGITASAATTACGVDHVRLVYCYLDEGEFDGYASLLDEHVQVRGVGAQRASGREEAAHAARANPLGRHELHKVIAELDSVVVTGRYLTPGGRDAEAAHFDFADVFTISDDALVLSQRRFYYLDEPPGRARSSTSP
ncbi:nuclear transport factor 2 family protein [Actinokineospora diospyrosa]|uniref:SnoaL-like domain-containing protein n=1 Tax=Actinokineospora diospyrosa TaxID=103728 RepID=A0ABT1IEV1_9PSEU|nr:nuclear transport factor 2 family protein [Actinokineospora diospyrosa]MCP2271163.1 SnoaL-like domain-containing protein [Actinokineospora diospyrosa]